MKMIAIVVAGLAATIALPASAQTFRPFPGTVKADTFHYGTAVHKALLDDMSLREKVRQKLVDRKAEEHVIQALVDKAQEAEDVKQRSSKIQRLIDAQRGSDMKMQKASDFRNAELDTAVKQLDAVKSTDEQIAEMLGAAMNAADKVIDTSNQPAGTCKGAVKAGAAEAKAAAEFKSVMRAKH